MEEQRARDFPQVNSDSIERKRLRLGPPLLPSRLLVAVNHEQRRGHPHYEDYNSGEEIDREALGIKVESNDNGERYNQQANKQHSISHLAHVTPRPYCLSHVARSRNGPSSDSAPRIALSCVRIYVASPKPLGIQPLRLCSVSASSAIATRRSR
jgi:hypothetical protein